jgi:CubicO group peptidase (beta-lactamase class C family)
MGKTKFTKRRILLATAVLVIAGFSIFAWQKYPFIAVGSAYKAKIVCSAVFLSGRDEASVLNEDVHADKLRELDSFDVKIDYENRSVTASFYGMISRTAVFRDGIGATLAIDATPEELRAEPRPIPAPEPLDPDVLWPEGERVDPAGIPKLDALVASEFDEPNPEKLLRTRAVVVVHDGRIIAEQYAPEFSPKTPLSGWSMTKSVTNALIGILVHQGKLARDNDDLLSLWRQPGDSRAAITLDNLLHMSSGLEFQEVYKQGNDVTAMLFRSGDASGYAAAMPLIHPPGSHFEYSSGTTNILCQVIRETIADDASYHAFPYEQLFHPIGAMSAIIERDAKGTFVGSSFMYASARDWARIGLLYANDGVWKGDQRILPEGWVDYSRTPAPTAAKATEKRHGAHFWLGFVNPANLPDLPEGIFHMSGHEGQFVTIIPEEKLVVVRLGLTLHPGAWKQEEFVAKILNALGK